jgi:hypothetical protein
VSIRFENFVPWRYIPRELEGSALTAYLFPGSTSSQPDEHQESILMKILRCSGYNRLNRGGAAVRQSSSSSATYFTFVLYSLVAIKVYQFYWYLIPLSIFVAIYKSIKRVLLYTYIYLSRQACIQNLIQQFFRFWHAR